MAHFYENIFLHHYMDVTFFDKMKERHIYSPFSSSWWLRVKCSLDMSLFYRKTRGLVNRSVHKTPTFIIEPFLYDLPGFSSVTGILENPSMVYLTCYGIQILQEGGAGMSSLEDMLKGYEIPEVVKIRTIFNRTRLENPEETLLERLRGKKLPVLPGQRIAITGGSRGIADYVPLMRAAVRYLKEMGAVPFIVPAMGSHGGATAEGQVEVLRNLGITEESVGAPIVSSMEGGRNCPDGTGFTGIFG